MVRNNLLPTDIHAIVGPAVTTDVRVEDIGDISNAPLSIGIVLARTLLPDLSIIDVSFARRVPHEAQ